MISGDAIKMDEYVPTKTPHIIALTKPLITSPPNKNNANNARSVVSEVIIVLERVWLIDLFKSFKDKFAVLHCVSKYPCQASDLSLDKIKKLVEIVDDNAVGLSDHFNGILTGPLGYMLGARVFVKLVSFDRSQKGSDHSFSLEPKGFSNFCRDINRVRDMCKINENNLGEEPVFQRLGKSLTLRFDCEKGQILDASHLSGKIFNDPGIPVREANSVIGKRLTRNMKSGSKILTGDIEKTI